MWLEIILISIGSILLLLGVIGSVLPVLPGPPLSFLGLVFFYFSEHINISEFFLFVAFLIAVFVWLGDWFVQWLTVAQTGGKKYAQWGTAIGVFVGFLLNFWIPIIPVILGPFIGAFIGALVDLKDNPDYAKAFIIALSSLIGFFLGAFLKVVYSVVIIIIVIVSFFTENTMNFLIEDIPQFISSLGSIF